MGDGAMSSGWARKTLGECVLPRETWNPRLHPRESIRYIEISGIDNVRGAISWAGTIEATMAPSRAKRVVRSGDVLFATTRPNLKNIAIVPKELDGEICSTGFCVLRPRSNLVTTGWLFAVARSDWFISRVIRHDEKNAYPSVSDDEVLAVEIPVPPLEEQERIMSHIEALARRADEACSLRRQTIGKAEGVCRAIMAADNGKTLVAVGELVRLRPPDVVVQPQESYHFAGVYSFGRGVFRSAVRKGSEFAYPKLTRLRKGDFVYPKLMAWEGAFGMVPEECDGCVVSTEYPVFEANEERVFPEVLDTHFRTPAVWPQIAVASTGTNMRRRRLKPRDFLTYLLPLPSRATQERLRQVRAKVDTLARLQAETTTALAAFTPALLAKAFRGEL